MIIVFSNAPIHILPTRPWSVVEATYLSSENPEENKKAKTKKQFFWLERLNLEIDCCTLITWLKSFWATSCTVCHFEGKTCQQKRQKFSIWYIII